jgi:hypothetical protein
MMVSSELFIDIILSAALWPWDQVNLASNRNEYQEYFLGGMGNQCVGLRILPSSCANCLEMWEPQHPGTLWACNRLGRECITFALPLDNLLPYMNM